MTKLHNRFEQQHEKFRKRWFDMSFDEPEIEEDFASKTFNQQKRYMYGILCLIMFYFTFAFFAYTVRKVASASAPSNSTCDGAGEQLWATDPGPADYYSLPAQESRLASALVYRGACIASTLSVVLFLRFAPRKLTLGAMVLFSYVTLFFFNLALWYEDSYDDIKDCLQGPEPRQSLPPLVLVMIVYTSAIPGIPFDIAAWICWGTMGVTLLSHLLMWPANAAGSHPSYPSYDSHWKVLGAQMVRIFLFNVFGTFVAIEQTRQMRLNFWHVRLLQEAVQLHKVIRQRFHRLTQNTLPAPIVQAIANGDTGFVKVYDQCTVLQADMVGFTPLSAEFSAEVVLGILSDIFEEFDTLGEQNEVDKVKTIGDAYIVCTGALSNPRPDDAQRIVRMGLQMQAVVARIAADKSIEVAVRIGVHTGRCTGGIIGTVRFHFDMWGAAVQGSVKMEEQGEKFRVHVSDATQALVRDRFFTEPHLREETLGDTEKSLGITQSYLIKGEIPASALALVTVGDAADDDELAHSGSERRHKSRLSSGPKNKRESSAAVGGAHHLRAVGLATKLVRQGCDQLAWVSGRNLAPAGTSGSSSVRADAAVGTAPAACAENNELGERDRTTSINFFVRSGSAAHVAGGGAVLDAKAATLGLGLAQTAAGSRTSHAAFSSTATLSRWSQAVGTGPRSSQRKPKRTSTSIKGSARSGKDAQNASTSASQNASQNASQSASQSASQNASQSASQNPSTTASGRGESTRQEPASGRGESTRQEPSPSVAKFAEASPRSVQAQCQPGTPIVPAQEPCHSLRNTDTTEPEASPRLGNAPATDRSSRGGAGHVSNSADRQSASSRGQSCYINGTGDSAIRVVGSGEEQPPPPLGPPPPPQPSTTSPRVRQGSGHSGPHGGSGLLTSQSATIAAKMQTAADANSAAVRILFTEAVRSALRRSAFATTTVLVLFGLYDWVLWQSDGPAAFFYLMRYIGAAMAAFPTFVLAFMRHLKGQQLPFINLLLLFGPWVCTLAMVFAAPARSRQYMLTVALFQLWSGYTMLSLPTAMLTCLQVFFSVLYCVTEWVMLDFPGANEMFRPSYDASGPSAKQSSPLGVPDMVIYLLSAHVLGILHNRRRRRIMRTHAKLLVTQEDRMSRIQDEVGGCADLLANIFPAPVLTKLQARGQSLSDGGKRIFAEKFDDCTFLFAKIVGLNDLIQRGEAGEVEPEQVVSALQLVFDRFDKLADTFKVQKVRKTVNEYYMVAAGLPDPEVLVGAEQRALAITALAFSMVHAMDVINAEPIMVELGVVLQCQVGINSGSAIAGIIGHKRFQYDLCGDAVNTAARMCSYSAPGCINVSPATLQLVETKYEAIFRGERAVKGKGNMALYFLAGRSSNALTQLLAEGPSAPLPPPVAAVPNIAAAALSLDASAGCSCGPSCEGPGSCPTQLSAIAEECRQSLLGSVLAGNLDEHFGSEPEGLPPPSPNRAASRSFVHRLPANYVPRTVPPPPSDGSQRDQRRQRTSSWAKLGRSLEIIAPSLAPSRSGDDACDRARSGSALERALDEVAGGGELDAGLLGTAGVEDAFDAVLPQPVFERGISAVHAVV